MKNEKMKQVIAGKMLQKLGSIDPSNIEAITVQLVMKGAPMEGMEGMGEMEHNEEPDENETPEEAATDSPEVQKKEYGKVMPKQKGKYCPDCGQPLDQCECD